MKSLGLKVILPIAILLLVVTGGTVLSRENAEDGKPAGQKKILAPAPTNIKIEPAVPTSIARTISLTGQTMADKEVRYSSEISGQIEYLAVELGSPVKKGKTLARIDYQLVKAQADQAQANYDLAKKTFERKEILGKKEMVSPQQLDESRAQMLAADAQLRIAKANLKKSIIRATIDGVVTGKYVEKGEFVAPGSQIVQVVDTNRIVIEAQVPEQQVSHVRPGCEVTVTIDALARDFTGKVDIVVPKADPVSGTFAVRVKVDNPDKEIFAGMSARMTITAGTLENVIVVPQDIVVEENEHRSVYVEQDGVAHRRDVQLGAVTGDRVVIDGIAAGDRLIVLGHRDLVDRQPVTVVND